MLPCFVARSKPFWVNSSIINRSQHANAGTSQCQPYGVCEQQLPYVVPVSQCGLIAVPTHGAALQINVLKSVPGLSNHERPAVLSHFSLSVYSVFCFSLYPALIPRLCNNLSSACLDTSEIFGEMYRGIYCRMLRCMLFD